MRINLSKSRLRKIRRHLSASFQDSRLDDEDRLVLAVGGLIGDGFTEDDLVAAFEDPSIVQVARVQLQRAREATG